ncbi:MAG: ABC transporter ATP-binding protein [Thaumarchaeota archaeon]|nr:ABC transporter ATP-binding protein [Nitrososphaerota archaeon]
MLKINDITVARNNNTILSNLSLNIGKNEIVAIFGHNGAGKSSLFKTICGLVKQSQGSISLDDVVIDNMKPNQRAELGIIQVQEGSRIFSSMTVLENLELGAFRNVARRNMEENLKEIFRIFPKLDERKDQKAGTLSGGEKQILAIARGLMSEPKLLMLDEPSLGLAPINKQQIFTTVKDMGSGFATLLIEQDILGALKISDRAIFMREGRIMYERSSNELLKDRQTIRDLMEL